MRKSLDPSKIAPREYELAVKGIIDSGAGTLVSYSSNHLESIEGVDGEYILDVTARFQALGVNFLIVIECKHERRKVERSTVQILHSKLVSLGAQKGIIFSISGFQSGAIDYAEKHGIALVHMVDGVSTWHTRSEGPPTPPPEWVDIPKYVGWLLNGDSRQLLSETYPTYTKRVLGLAEVGPN